MVLGYYRLGKFEDARRSMQQLLTFARRFRMDNPLVEWGGNVYQPHEPINLCYDTFAPAAAMVRGLFEYLYRADALTLIPHIPPSITRLEQRFPIRFGTKRLYLSAAGSGAIVSVWVNGEEWTNHDADTISLPYAVTPETAHIQIVLGDAAGEEPWAHPLRPAHGLPPAADPCWDLTDAAAAMAGNVIPLRFGSDSNGASLFTGDFGPISICNQALDDSAIKVLASDWAAEPEHCVAQWTFEEMRTGPYPARFVLAGDLVDTPRGRAARLDGSGHIRVGHHDDLNLTQAFTLAAWICPAVLPEPGVRIIDKIPAGRDEGYLLDTYPGDGLRVITPEGTLHHPARLPVGEWTHVAATFASGDKLRLYVNGERVAEGPCQKEGVGASSFGELRAFYERLVDADLETSYEGQHARLALDCVLTVRKRMQLSREGKLTPLPAESQTAADRAYLSTAAKLRDGLVATVKAYADTPSDDHKRHVLHLWRGVETDAPTQ